MRLFAVIQASLIDLFYQICENNVVETIINEIYVTELLPRTKLSGITHLDLDRLNTLVMHNNDLEKIFESYKSLGGKGQRSKVLKPYKELLKMKAIDDESEKIKLLEELKEKLKW